MGRAFALDTIEEVVHALEVDGSEWAGEQVRMLSLKSPQALKVTLRQMRLGARKTSFADDLAMEYRIACHVVGRHDFLEGVRVLFKDKGSTPSWNPRTLNEISERAIDEIFAPLDPGEEWSPLNAIEKARTVDQ